MTPFKLADEAYVVLDLIVHLGKPAPTYDGQEHALSPRFTYTRHWSVLAHCVGLDKPNDLRLSAENPAVRSGWSADELRNESNRKALEAEQNMQRLLDALRALPASIAVGT